MKVNFAPILLAVVMFLAFFPPGAVTASGTAQVMIIGTRLPNPPEAAFTADMTCGCRPLTVTFTDQSTGNPTSWKWEYRKTGSAGWTQFGSGAPNPSHTFSTRGSYDIRLTVINMGGSDTATKPGYITVVTGTPPVDFEASPTRGPGPLMVTFTDRTACGIQWRWEEKPGSIFSLGGWSQFSTLNPASYTFTRTGTYSIKLTVWNACNHPASRVKSSYITVTCPTVTAAMSAGPASGRSPLTVIFTDRSSGPYTSWRLDFGDGTGTGIQDPSTNAYSHTYTLPAGTGSRTYIARLTVKNDCSSSIKSISITVNK